MCKCVKNYKIKAVNNNKVNIKLEKISIVCYNKKGSVNFL